MKNWLFLFVAIISEVIATSSLKLCDGFSRFWPSVVVILGYSAAFYFLSLTLRSIPVGIAYAVWSGVGIMLVSLIGWTVFGQKLDIPALVGITLILSGVLIMNIFSSTISH